MPIRTKALTRFVILICLAAVTGCAEERVSGSEVWDALVAGQFVHIPSAANFDADQEKWDPPGRCAEGHVHKAGTSDWGAHRALGIDLEIQSTDALTLDRCMSGPNTFTGNLQRETHLKVGTPGVVFGTTASPADMSITGTIALNDGYQKCLVNMTGSGNIKLMRFHGFVCGEPLVKELHVP